MSSSDRGDRGALVALALVVAAVVIIALFDGAGEPANQVVGQPHSADVKANQNADVAQRVASSNDFHPWRDTYAQWLIAVLSVAATGVSIWAVRLLRRTLQETQKATRTAREIGEAQVRAYISVSEGRIDLSVSDFLLLGHVEINYTNKGQSPAFHVIFDLGLTVIEKPNLIFPEEGDVKQYSCQIPSQIVLTVAAGKTETFRQAILKSSVPNEWRENIAAGRVRLLVNGTLRWTDVFNVVETNRIFCLENTDRDYFAVVPPKGDLRVTQMRLSQKKATE